jgi:hypothetical protein
VNGDHVTWTMDWLEDNLAVEGKKVFFKGHSDSRVWMVTEAFRGLPMSKDWVADSRRAHDRWRAVTDV